MPASEARLTPEDVCERFDLEWERDYNFTTKQEFGRIKWREKGKRGRWKKLALHTSEIHPTLSDLYEHRASYLAAWLNGDVR